MKAMARAIGGKIPAVSNGGGYGGRRGGMGGGRGDMGGVAAKATKERQKMRGIILAAGRDDASMTGAEVDSGGRPGPQARVHDRRKETAKSKDTNYQEIAGKFDGKAPGHRGKRVPAGTR